MCYCFALDYLFLLFIFGGSIKMEKHWTPPNHTYLLLLVTLIIITINNIFNKFPSNLAKTIKVQVDIYLAPKKGRTFFSCLRCRELAFIRAPLPTRSLPGGSSKWRHTQKVDHFSAAGGDSDGHIWLWTSPWCGLDLLWALTDKGGQNRRTGREWFVGVGYLSQHT